MSGAQYDVVLLSDFRFPGGTSSAVAEEIKASAAAGYRTALIHLEAPNLTYPFPISPKLRPLIDAGLAELVDPDQAIEAHLAIVHNPYTLQHLPHRGLALQSEHRMLVVHHPPSTADGEPFYDVTKVQLHAEETLGGEVLWAPVGPSVRAQFDVMDRHPPLLDQDWFNVVEPKLWATPRDKFADRRPVIGRHTRPDRRKWPDTRELTLAVYPDDPRFLVRIMGGAPFLAELVGLYPRNWQVLAFDALPPQDFLRTIDFLVYYHHSQWVEAFGCTIVEAMASGAVAVLPPHFEPLFGEGALYAQPEEAAELVLAHRENEHAYARQSACGRQIVDERFSHGAHVSRLQQLIGPPRRSSSVAGAAKLERAPSPKKRERRVLLLSSNGVGMGHLTRLLAIARRLDAPIQPVFVTMSQGLKVVQDLGYLAEYLPYHEYLGCDINDWNKHLCRELDELIAFYDTPVVICDFNSPFQGVIDAIHRNPQAWFVWCRRGMWRPGAGAKFIDREHHFDAILEPRELAGAFDAGLTAQSRGRTRMVGPIRLLDNEEMLARDLARRELGLDLDRPAVLVQLGSGNNYDYSTLRHLTLDHLSRRQDVQVVVAEWVMSERSIEMPAGVIGLQRFPLSRWFKAFDASISAVGYNSFHDLIYAGIPTIFVPNENPVQDDQLTRARYAERHGFGFCVRTRDVYRLAPTLDRLLDPVEQLAIAARCAELDATNGAVESAQMIEEMLCIRRADRSRAA